MRIDEIERLNRDSYVGGKEAIGQAYKADGLVPLPGGSGYFYSVMASSAGPTINIWDTEGKKVIAQLDLGSRPTTCPLKNAMQVGTINVDEDYRGQGLAKALYGIVLTILKYPLIAGDSQTPGGRRNWVSLASIPGVEVKGYVELNTNHMWSEHIDTVMGKLGGQYLGTSKDDTHWFAFDVQPTSTGRELKAYVKTNLSKLYYDLFDYNGINTGLIAIWTGK